MKPKPVLTFIKSGIKVDGGKVQRVDYSDGELLHYPKGTITVYARPRVRFSQEVREAFVVENNSDMREDYFEWDRIRVVPTHPLYAAVKAALELKDGK